jgi:hypothetical protein
LDAKEKMFSFSMEMNFREEIKKIMWKVAKIYLVAAFLLLLSCAVIWLFIWLAK